MSSEEKPIPSEMVKHKVPFKDKNKDFKYSKSTSIAGKGFDLQVPQSGKLIQKSGPNDLIYDFMFPDAYDVLKVLYYKYYGNFNGLDLRIMLLNFIIAIMMKIAMTSDEVGTIGMKIKNQFPCFFKPIFFMADLIGPFSTVVSKFRLHKPEQTLIRLIVMAALIKTVPVNDYENLNHAAITNLWVYLQHCTVDDNGLTLIDQANEADYLKGFINYLQLVGIHLKVGSKWVSFDLPVLSNNDTTLQINLAGSAAQFEHTLSGLFSVIPGANPLAKFSKLANYKPLHEYDTRIAALHSKNYTPALILSEMQSLFSESELITASISDPSYLKVKDDLSHTGTVAQVTRFKKNNLTVKSFSPLDDMALGMSTLMNFKCPHYLLRYAYSDVDFNATKMKFVHDATPKLPYHSIPI